MERVWRFPRLTSDGELVPRQRGAGGADEVAELRVPHVPVTALPLGQYPRMLRKEP